MFASYYENVTICLLFVVQIKASEEANCRDYTSMYNYICCNKWVMLVMSEWQKIIVKFTKLKNLLLCYIY